MTTLEKSLHIYYEVAQGHWFNISGEAKCPWLTASSSTLRLLAEGKVEPATLSDMGVLLSPGRTYAFWTDERLFVIVECQTGTAQESPLDAETLAKIRLTGETFRRQTKELLLASAFQPDASIDDILQAFTEYTFSEAYSLWAYNPVTDHFTLVASSFDSETTFLSRTHSKSTLAEVLLPDTRVISRPLAGNAFHCDKLSAMRSLNRFAIYTPDDRSSDMQLTCVVSFYCSRTAVAFRRETVNLIRACIGQKLSTKYSTYVARYRQLLTHLAQLQPRKFTFELQEFVRTLAEALGYEAASIFFVDARDTTHLRCVATFNAEGKSLVEAGYPIDGKSMTAEVYRTGSPVFSYDISRDPRNSGGYSEPTRSAPRNWIGVPIAYAENRYGVLRVKNRSENGAIQPFTAIDMEVLSNIASVIAAGHHAESAFVAEKIQSKQRKRELSDLEEFLKTFRHEVRSPLTFVTTAAGRIRRALKRDLSVELIPKHLDNMLDDLEGIATRLTFVTNQLTFDAQVLVKDIRRNNILKDVVAPVLAFATSYGYRRKRYFLIQKDTLHVDAICDANSASMAFHALIDNAIKYSNPESTILVRGIQSDRFVFVEIVNQVDIFRIESDEKETIFEKYGRGKIPRIQSVEGSGIGLYLAREIMHANRGDVQLVTKPDSVMFRLQFRLPPF